MAIKLSGVVADVFKPIHRAVKENRYVHYWLKGGRASGKSSYISIEIVQGLIRTKDANAIIYRKVANTLADSVVSQCLWAIKALGVEDWFLYKKSPYELVFKSTGQRIMFRGADDPEKSKGIKLSSGFFKYIWFEELTEFAGMDEVETITRSLMRGEGRASVFYSYNPPKSVQHWVNAECLIPKENRIVHHSSYLDLPEKWIGEQFIAEALAVKNTNELKYRWAYMGEATGTGGAVFDNVVIREIAAEEIMNMDKIYDGLDFGYTIDPTGYIAAYYHPALMRVYILNEFYRVRASYDKIAEEIKKVNPGRVVVADSAEPRSIDELKERGIMITGAKKAPGSVEHGISWLQNLNQIVIDPKRTPNAAREFIGYEYELDRYGNFKAAYPDVNNHAVDAVRYALESVIAHRRLRTVEGIRL